MPWNGNARISGLLEIGAWILAGEEHTSVCTSSKQYIMYCLKSIIWVHLNG